MASGHGREHDCAGASQKAGVFIPFSRITVIDHRDDTSSVGYIKRKSGKKIFRILLQPSLQAAATEYLNQAVAAAPDADTPGLLMVIKKLRLTDEVRDRGMNDTRYQGARYAWDGGIVSKFEFYLQMGEDYYPIYRFDSSFLYRYQVFNNEDELLRHILLRAVEKMQTVNCGTVASSRRKTNMAGIIARDAGRWNLPCLKTAARLKGVYRSFEEFVQNKPYYTEFRFDAGDKADLLFVNENGTMTPTTREVWGFCDSCGLNIKCGSNFFEMERCGNTFAFKGSRTLNQRINPFTSNRFHTEFDMILRTRAYQLDMETGRIY